MRFDAILGQGINDRLLQQRHQLAHTQLAAFKVQQNIHYLLSWTVIGHLAAAIALDHRNIAGHQHVFRFACLALSEDRVMFHQPDLVEGVFIAGVGEFMHRLRDGFVWLQAKLPDKNFIVLQNNISAGKREFRLGSISQPCRRD